MATPNEIYKVALENREALNRINDLAKKTEDYSDAGVLVDTDAVRVSRGGISLKTTVADIKSASGGGDLNVQPDWLEADALNDAYIKNKPENLSDFNNDLPASNGDMLKSVYDKDNNGRVDDADKLNGQVPSFYNQNAHVADATIHVSSAEKDAMTSANAPTGANPFATIVDLQPLTDDQKDAINGANSPAAGNPFATINDIAAGGSFFISGIVAKYPGNINLTLLEVNDMLCNVWWSTTLYIKEAQYNGGDTALIGSYTIIDSIEF